MKLAIQNLDVSRLKYFTLTFLGCSGGNQLAILAISKTKKVLSIRKLYNIQMKYGTTQNEVN